MNARQIIKILEANGFICVRRDRHNHARYEAVIDGKARLVSVPDGHGARDVTKKTLASIIQQSGLGKKAFR